MIDLPPSAAWRHVTAREGFETTFFAPAHLDGHTSAVEDGVAWAVHFAITTDPSGRTTLAAVTGWSATGRRTVMVTSDGDGRWLVDGERARHLDGCDDVDLESSSCTNLLPVRRLALAVGEHAVVPAAYVRAADLAVIRLEQTYHRLPDGEHGPRYEYTSATFDFRAVLSYDASGLVVDYPGIAVRVA
jgi:uncharacterized protein